MTDWMDGFVPDDGQLIRRTMGETLAQMVRRRWPHHTAKQVAKAWGLDPTTAANLTKGHASERTLTKAARAERWALWMALGQELFGQSYAEWEEQRLQRIIEEAQYELGKVRRLRAMDAGVLGTALDPLAAPLLDTDFAPEPSARRDGSGSQTGAR